MTMPKMRMRMRMTMMTPWKQLSSRAAKLHSVSQCAMLTSYLCQAVGLVGAWLNQTAVLMADPAVLCPAAMPTAASAQCAAECFFVCSLINYSSTCDTPLRIVCCTDNTLLAHTCQGRKISAARLCEAQLHWQVLQHAASVNIPQQLWPPRASLAGHQLWKSGAH